MRFSKITNNDKSQSCIVEEENLIDNNYSRSKYGSSFVMNDRLSLNHKDITLNIEANRVKHEKEYDDYIESWEGDDQGLIWGKKEAKDKSWEERWIEQRNIPNDSNNIKTESMESSNSLYILQTKCVEDNSRHEPGNYSEIENTNDNRASLGQLSGIDYKKNKRWSEKWFRKGNKLLVRKYIEDLCENNVRVIKFKFEDSEFELEHSKEDGSDNSWKLVQINKYGKDCFNSKEWREHTIVGEDSSMTVYQERGLKAKLNKPFSFLCKRRKSFTENSEIIYNSYKSGDFLERTQFDTIDSSKVVSSSKISIGEEIGKVRKEIERQFDSDNLNEEWREYIEVDNRGNKKGKRRGIKNKTTEWCEIWSEQIDGTNETDRWFFDEKKQWGEKFGYSKSNNEKFSVVWEEFKDQDDSKFKTVKKDWEKVGENNLWGERITERSFKDNKTELIKENWYNNGSENFKEEFYEEQIHDFEEFVMKNGRIPKSVNRRGKKRGENIFTGETWSEDWNETLIRRSDMDELLRINHYTNKWWNSKNGDEWGEKRMQKIKSISSKDNKSGFEEKMESYSSQLEGEFSLFVSGETWKRSPDYESFDYWEKDGLQERGNKKGSDRKQGEGKHLEWSENWERDESGEFNKNCSWKLCDSNGLIEMWEEKEIIEKSGRLTIFKCGTEYEFENRSKVKQKWEEEYEDDGKGNTRTKKSGKGVENWYLDEFGTSEENGEKWAVKKGYNNEGRWEERWSEKPYYKEAWKKGENSIGDKWEEEWKEDFKNKWKWAQKKGQNNIGDRWREEWREEIDQINNLSKKTAKKEGMKLHTGEEWSEEWGETYYGFRNEYMGCGNAITEFVEKWTKKFATDGAGNLWGNSWGDHWEWGSKVKSWGEKWENDSVIERW